MSKTLKIKNTPGLKISRQIKPPSYQTPSKNGSFHYEARDHKNLPHIVKFSGGRTSGMMMFTLLESGLLKRERGDAVIFNNTSAEHPATYEFVRMCQEVVEKQYGIPFFWLQFQTYEDARKGEWRRCTGYRLVKPEPWSKKEPDGYHWKGEVFEELLSHQAFVPSQHDRSCTQNLKLFTTREFLRDWLANKESIDHLGHNGKTSRIDKEILYKRHRWNQGSVPKDIFLKKKKYVLSRPIYRPSQAFRDYSSAAEPFNNKTLVGKIYGGKAVFNANGDGDGAEYIAFIGLRHDEMRRVVRVQKRNAGGPESIGYEGEHVYIASRQTRHI